MKYIREFIVTVAVDVADEALIDEALIPYEEAGSRNFYGFKYHVEVIDHLAWNCVKNGVWNANRLDGWADLEGDELTMEITDITEY